MYDALERLAEAPEGFWVKTIKGKWICYELTTEILRYIQVPDTLKIYYRPVGQS